MPEYSGNDPAILREVHEAGYELYKRVGHGGAATIDFGLRREHADAFREGKSMADILKARRQLIAVKFGYGKRSSSSENWNEVQTLRRIKAIEVTEDEYDFRKHLSWLVHEGNFNDQSEDDPQCSWFVIEAVPTGLTLYTLTKLDPDDSKQDDGIHRAFHKLMPVEMICHLFVSIGSAVDFLHKHNIMHGDIKDENVMLDEATLDDPVELQDYPKFVLVDFGMAANIRDDPRRAEMECSRLCRMFHGLITEHIRCSGPGAGAEPPWQMEGSICTAKEDPLPWWEEFAQYMADNADEWKPNAQNTMTRMMANFHVRAKERRRNSKPSLQNYIRMVVREAIAFQQAVPSEVRVRKKTAETLPLDRGGGISDGVLADAIRKYEVEKLLVLR